MGSTTIAWTLSGPDLAHGALEHVDVAERDGAHGSEQRPERRLVLLVRGERQRAERLAVVAALEVDERGRLGPAARANFRAVSIASAPLLLRNTWLSAWLGARSDRIPIKRVVQRATPRRGALLREADRRGRLAKKRWTNSIIGGYASPNGSAAYEPALIRCVPRWSSSSHGLIGPQRPLQSQQT
jgi:hypothetical protein